MSKKQIINKDSNGMGLKASDIKKLSFPTNKHKAHGYPTDTWNYLNPGIHQNYITNNNYQQNFQTGLYNNDMKSKKSNNSNKAKEINQIIFANSSNSLQDFNIDGNRFIPNGNNFLPSHDLFMTEEMLKIHAKDKRRERNKIFARKTRMKRKLELEELRDRVCHLKMENEALKGIFDNHTISTTECDDILLKIDLQLPNNTSSNTHMISKLKDGESKLLSNLLKNERSFCISSAVAPDCPLVYVSPGFCKLTGYEASNTIGKNCRFLQGIDTDLEQVTKINSALKSYREFEMVVRNYKKNGEAFWNLLQVVPMKDYNGLMTLIIGVQTEVFNPTEEMKVLKYITKDKSNFNFYLGEKNDKQPDYKNYGNYKSLGEAKFNVSESGSTTSCTGNSDTSSSSEY